MVESEWTEVKTKKKFVPKKETAPTAAVGGIKKGHLVAGPIASQSTKYGGPGAYGGAGAYGGSDAYGQKADDSDEEWKEVEPIKPKGQATAIAEYDFGVDKGTVDKDVELVSHTCAAEVAAARTKAKLT